MSSFKGINRLSEELLKKKFLDLGLKLLSPYSEYKTQESKLKYVARCGHENTASLVHIRRGRGLYCKRCVYRERTLKYRQSSIDKIINTLRSCGCRLVSPCKDNIVLGGKITFVPKCGHGTRTMTCGNFLQASKSGYVECKRCSQKRHNRKIHYTEDDVEKILSECGCKYIKGSYVNSESLVSFVARCGHPEREYFSHIRRKKYSGLCKLCMSEKRKRPGKSRILETCSRLGCTLKQYKGSLKPNVIIGSCGHEFTSTIYGLEQHVNGECPICSKHTSENLVYKIVGDIFNTTCLCEFRIHDHRPYQYIDVVVPGINLAIEYNGEQHYTYVKIFHRTKSDFLDQLKRDARKRAWCKDNKYMLVELDGRKVSTQYGNITKDWISSEIEKQTGHSIEYFKKILEDEKCQY